jgi:hypothetical protein
MDNHIRDIEVYDRSLIPAEAEVRISVVPEHHSATAELRGRLMGPRCAYASTVEVAYPLRPLPLGPAPPVPAALGARVVIPEASLWEPESPFLYRGPVALWQDGRRCDQVTICHGLRSFQLGPRGLRVNGRLVALRGRQVTACSDEEARALRRDCCNLLLAPVTAETPPLWERGDRLGLLLLGRVTDDSEPTRRHLAALARHACCLGWVLDAGSAGLAHHLPPGGLVGFAGGAPPPAAGMQFCVGPAAELANFGLPLLVTGEAVTTPTGHGASPILGSVL